MATASLYAAIGWAVAVAGAVAFSGWVRARSARSSDSAGPTSKLCAADLVVGGFVGIAGYAAILLGIHFTVRFTVFGGIALTYLVLVLGVPLAMAGALVAAWIARRRGSSRKTMRLVTRPALAICGAGLLLAPIGFYATHIEPGLLDVDRPEPLALAVERDGEDTITIGVLSDLQTTTIGDHEREAVRQLMAAEPDLILLPGDILQLDDAPFDRELPALLDLFGELKAPGGVFLVGGDVDKPLDRLDRMVETTDVRHLADEVVTTTVGDRVLTIGGIGVDYESARASAVIEQLERDPGTDDIRILLSHRPDPVLGLRPGSRIDLQVSGHTHGGQVSVPFVGPLMTLSSVPRHVAAGGLHAVNGNAVYVARGVGLERGSAPQVRFGVRPDIGVLTITD